MDGAEDTIKEQYEQKDDRDLARELQIPEAEVRQIREDLGLFRLDAFTENSVMDDQQTIKAEFDTLQRRKLQGFVGEEVCRLLRSELCDRLAMYLKENWELHQSAELITPESQTGTYRLGRRPDRGDLMIDHGIVKHHGADDTEIRSYVEDRCFVADRDLLEIFHRVENPWIDEILYAIHTTGQVETTVPVQGYEDASITPQDTITATVPQIDDFKIVAVEIKTTTGDGRTHLSSNQRAVRDLAQTSPYLDFFVATVKTDFTNLDLPASFNIELAKES